MHIAIDYKYVIKKKFNSTVSISYVAICDGKEVLVLLLLLRLFLPISHSICLNVLIFECLVTFLLLLHEKFH